MFTVIIPILCNINPCMLFLLSIEKNNMTDNKDLMHFEPQTPQYRKLKNGEFTSLTLRIMNQAGNIITDGPQVTVVLHIKYNPL